MSDATSASVPMDVDDSKVDYKALYERERQGRERERQEKEEVLGFRAKAEQEAATRDKERHAWQEKRLSHKRLRFEGWDDSVLIHEARLQSLLADVLRHRLLLLRAPPGSGKSSLAQIFAIYCANQGHPVYSLSLKDFEPALHPTTDDYFRTCWSDYDGTSLTTTFTAILKRAEAQDPRNPSPILILDESQVWFGKIMPAFWSKLKGCENLLSLCFSAFGHAADASTLGTPIQFDHYLGFPQLQLSKEDVIQIAGTMKSNKNPVFPDVMELLHARTNGQAGMIREALDTFFQTGSTCNTRQAQIDFLHSHLYFQDLRRSRSLMLVPQMYLKLDETGVSRDQFLDLILQTKRATVPVNLDPKDPKRPVVLSFGVFYQDNEDDRKLYLICQAAFDVLLTEHLMGKFSRRTAESHSRTSLSALSNA